VYSRFCKFPKVDHYVETGRLLNHQRQILVGMKYRSPTNSHKQNIFVKYDTVLYDKINKDRWDPFKNKPIPDAGSLCYLLRKVTNSHPSRIEAVRQLIKITPKLIIFYNFNYELDLLRDMSIKLNIPFTEWNGHNHDPIPDTDNWIYLVQYTAGAEGWNCVVTNNILFYSQNYSYKIMTQSAGRIDRMNTPFKELYYKYLISNSPIDMAIMKSLNNKKTFNESGFINKEGRNTNNLWLKDESLKVEYQTNEIWRDVVGYEGLYMVSNLGNVKSLNYGGTTGIVQLLKLGNVNGYLKVDLTIDKKQKLVWFIDW